MFNLDPSLSLGLLIPTSYEGVEALSPLTPISNHLFGIDSYGLGAFGIGASNLFSGGLYGSPAPFGQYGRFADTMPSFNPLPFFAPPVHWLMPAGNTVQERRNNNLNPANFLNFSSSTTSSVTSNKTDSPKKAELKSKQDVMPAPVQPKPPAKPTLRPAEAATTDRPAPRQPETASPPPPKPAKPPAAATAQLPPEPPKPEPPKTAPVPKAQPRPAPVPAPAKFSPTPVPLPSPARPSKSAAAPAPLPPPLIAPPSPSTVPERLKYGRMEFIRSDSFYVNTDKQHYFVDVSDIADGELARQMGENEIAKLTAEGILEENWTYFEYKENGKAVKRFFECGVKQEAEKTGSDNSFVFDLVRSVGAENVELVAFYHQHPLSAKDTEANNVLFPPSPLDMRTAINISKRFAKSGFGNIPVEHVVVETAGAYRFSPQEAVLKSKDKAEVQIQPYLASVQTLTRPNPESIIEALETVNFNASFRFFNPNLEKLVKTYDEMRNYNHNNILTPNRKINFRREIDQLLETFSDEEKKKYRGILKNISDRSHDILNDTVAASD